MKGCKLGGALPGDAVWKEYTSLCHVDLTGTTSLEDGPIELPLSLLRVRMGGGVVALDKSLQFTIPKAIGELGIEEVDLSGWSFVGPPLPETMQMLMKLAPKLTKLNLNGCALGGQMPGDDVWSAFPKLDMVDLAGSDVASVLTARLLCL